MPHSSDDSGRLLRDLDFLAEVTRETLSTLQLDLLLQRVVRLMRERFGYDYAAVALVEGEDVEFKAGSGSREDQQFGSGEYRLPPWRIRVGQGLIGTVVSTCEPRLVNDVSSDTDYMSVGFLPDTRSELTVPLVHQKEVLGVLDVQSNRAGAFDDTDRRLLEIVGALVSPAVHTARLHERWRRRMRYLNLLGEISRLVLASLTEETVVEVACEAIRDALDVSFAGIALVQRGGSLIHAGHAARAPLRVRLPQENSTGQGLTGRVACSGRSIRLADVRDMEDFIHVVEGMRSAICVPLQIRDRIIGVLDVEDERDDHFGDEDQRHLENLAIYIAQGLQNAQLFEAQRRRWQQLLVINEAARIATEPLDLDEILVQVVREVHDRFGYFAVAVFLKDDRDLVLRAVRCEEPVALAVGHRLPPGSGLAGQVAESGVTAEASGLANRDAVGKLRGDIDSILCVPLLAQTGVVGVVAVQSTEAAAFNGDDRLVMETLTKSVAGAIANARAVRQTEQLREDLNRMIVHDLRNPVQAVLLTLQEVQHAAPGTLPDRLTESVGDGMACAEEILGMVNSLLDVSRFEAGKAQLRVCPAVLNDHVRASVRRFAPIAHARAVELLTDLSPEVPVLRLDHELIERTLANLIGNALKFTPERSQVLVRTDAVAEPRAGCPTAPPFVLVSVKDAGEGIPHEYQVKIFEKFGQVESRKAGLEMSTGLGLTLCRYVVEAHGGAVWVDSAPGQGSTFYFSLPVSR